MAGWAGSAGQRYKGLVIRLQCSDSGFTDTRDITTYTVHSTLNMQARVHILEPSEDVVCTLISSVPSGRAS